MPLPLSSVCLSAQAPSTLAQSTSEHGPSPAQNQASIRALSLTTTTPACLLSHIPGQLNEHEESHKDGANTLHSLSSWHATS